MHTKFVQLKADADLFSNGTVLGTRPYCVKYGPFQQIVKVLAPEWSCSGNQKAIWDLILRLDYGPSPLDGRFELKSSFLGKSRVQTSNNLANLTGTLLESSVFPSSKQVVFHRNVQKKVPIGTCQVSCTVGMVDILPFASNFTARLDSSEERKAKKERGEDMSTYLERMQCQCSQEQIDL